MTDEELDRIKRAEEIQRYTENRCDALEKENKILKSDKETFRAWKNNLAKENERLAEENTELKAFRQDCVKLTEDNVVMARQRAETAKKLNEAKEIIKKLMEHLSRYVWIGDNKTKPVMEKDITKAEQFLKEVSE